MIRRIFDIVTARLRALYLQIHYKKCNILADNQTLIDEIDFSGSQELAIVNVTEEGIIILGTTISKSAEFHFSHINKVVDEAKPTLQAIAEFGRTHLQQALVLLKSYDEVFILNTSNSPPPHSLPPSSRCLTECQACHRGNAWT